MKKRRERNECGGLSACSYGRTDQPWRIQRSIGMKQAVHGWLSTYERLVKSQNFFSSYLTQEDIRRLRRDGVLHGVGQFGSPGTVQTQKKQCQTEQDFFHSSDSNRSQTARNSGRDTTMAATAPAVSSTEARAPSPASRHRSEPVRQIRAMQTVFSSG